MAAFASSYGTFLTVLPASPPEASAPGGWAWAGDGALGNGSSTTTRSSNSSGSLAGLLHSSPPPSAAAAAAAAPGFPVHYRCLLLSSGEDGGAIGVRLEWAQGLLRVAAVLSESVQGVCQVAWGDIITHINGEGVHQLEEPPPPAEEEEEEGESGVRPLRLLLRASSSSSSSSRQPRAACSPRRRAVVELRLIRARTLPHPPLNPHPTAAPSPPTTTTTTMTPAAAYARLYRATGPMLLYEAHARDSLAGIAARFRTTAQEVRRDNRDVFPPGEPVLPTTVQPGLLLRIRNPEYVAAGGGGGGGGNGHAPLTPERRFSSAPSSSSTTAAAAFSGSTGAAGSAGGKGGRRLLQRRYHLVAAGETLEGIARAYGVGVMDVRKWNRGLFPVGEPRAAVAGDRLLLFCRRGPEEEERGGKDGGKSSRPIAIAAGGSGGGKTGGSGMPSPE